MGFEGCIGVPWGEEITEESILPEREQHEQRHSGCLPGALNYCPGKGKLTWL